MAIDSNRAYPANLGRPAPSEAPVKLASESFADDDVASNRASGCLPMTRGSDGDKCRRQQRRARLHQNRPCSEAEIRLHGLQRSRHKTYLASRIHTQRNWPSTGAIEVRPLSVQKGCRQNRDSSDFFGASKLSLRYCNQQHASRQDFS